MANLQPQFSIVIPVHNGERYLANAIDSVLKQTYSQFELIILENCSTDNTLAVASSHSDDRIRVLPASMLLSIEDNWARVLDLDLLDFVVLMGCDDLLEPEFLQEIANLSAAFPDASLYQTHFNLIDKEGRLIRPARPIAQLETAEVYLRGRHLGLRDCHCAGYAARSVQYKRVGGMGRFPGLMYADDVAWCQLMSNTPKVSSPRRLYSFRVHDQSTSSSADLLMLYEAFRRYRAFLEGIGYLRQKDNAIAFYDYVADGLIGRQRTALLNLIMSPDHNGLGQYRRAKAQLVAAAERDRLFKVDDWSLHVGEIIASLPIRVLQVLLGQSIMLVKSVRHWVRQDGG